MRKAYPSDVCDEEWAFVAPYLTLLSEDVREQRYPLREALDGPRRVARTGTQWRLLPHDLPYWDAVYQH